MPNDTPKPEYGPEWWRDFWWSLTPSQRQEIEQIGAREARAQYTGYPGIKSGQGSLLDRIVEEMKKAKEEK